MSSIVRQPASISLPSWPDRVLCPPPSFSSFIDRLRPHSRVASFFGGCSLVVRASQPPSIVASSLKHHVVVLHGVSQPHSRVASSLEVHVLHECRILSQWSRPQSCGNLHRLSLPSWPDRVLCPPPSFLSFIDRLRPHLRVASFFGGCSLVVRAS